VIGILLALFFKSGIDAALSDYHAHRYQSAATQLEQFVRRAPRDPAVPQAMYYLALLQPTIDSAQALYNRVIREHPRTDWAERSCLNLAKIDYALNNCLDAVSTLTKFIDRYPNSSYRAEALYWLGLSYTVLHDRQSAEKISAKLVAEFSQNHWASRAVIQVVQNPAIQETVVTKSAGIPPPIIIPKTIPKPFTIQVGSFQSITNAQHLLAKLKPLGYAGEIKEAVVQGKNYFRVWVGSFQDAADAAPVLQSLKNNGLNGQLVKR
jgi:tetratricopeptide (TPR) repeat protein